MKKNLFLVLLVLLLCTVGFGFYRGWFALTSPDSGNNQVNVNLSVDPDKVKADAGTVKEKAADLTGTAAEPAGNKADGTTGEAAATSNELDDPANGSK